MMVRLLNAAARCTGAGESWKLLNFSMHVLYKYNSLIYIRDGVYIIRNSLS